MGNQLAKRFQRNNRETDEYKKFLREIHPYFRSPFKCVMKSYHSQEYAIMKDMVKKKNLSLEKSSLPTIVRRYYRDICKQNRVSTDCLPIVKYVYTFFNDDEESVARDNLTLFFLIRFMENYLLLKNFNFYGDFVFANKLAHPLERIEDPNYCDEVTSTECYRGLTLPMIQKMYPGTRNDLLAQLVFSTFEVCQNQATAQCKNDPEYQSRFSDWRDF